MDTHKVDAVTQKITATRTQLWTLTSKSWKSKHTKSWTRKYVLIMDINTLTMGTHESWACTQTNHKHSHTLAGDLLALQAALSRGWGRAKTE